MSKYLLALLILAFPLISQAQEYHPFPTENTVWAEYFYPGGGDYPNVYHYFSLKNGDTIIDDHSYHKLYFSYDTIFTEDKLCGGLREENKRVYYYSADSLTCLNYPIHTNTEILLYDFNLQIGDTISNEEFRIRGGGNLVVKQLDRILIDQGYRKIYTFGYDNHIFEESQWVEGIGCLKGLLADIGPIPTNDLYSDLVCFIQDNKILYHNDLYSQCYNMNPTNNVRTLDFGRDIKISCNPIITSAILEFNNHEFQKLIIYDLSGKIKRKYNIEGKQSIIIEQRDLQKGMYFLSVSDKAGDMQTMKILFE